MANFDKENRLSETAERILRESEVVASSLDSGIDTQHLLAALAATSGTIAFETLREQHVSPERIKHLLITQPELFKPCKGISQDLKLVLKSAYRQASINHTPTVDTEHLLLGLLMDKNNNAYRALDNLDADPQLMREQLLDYFDQIHNTGEHAEDQLEQDELPEGQFPLPDQDVTKTAPKPKSAIEYFCTNLTQEAKDGKLDPVIGRSVEIRRISQILIRRTKNNPVLTGEPGVGKTAIVEGLAERIASGDIPTQLADKKVLSLDLALLISGTTYRGQFEERTKRLVDEIIKAGNIILFVDEIHTIVGAGAAEGSIDLGNILKPALAKGKLRLIGATTNEEYRKYIEKDPALERRLQRVTVEEPNINETIEILKGLRTAYEKHHNVVIDDESIEAAAELSKRYISDRFLPDKAIDLIDEAAAAKRLDDKKLSTTNRVVELEKQAKKAADDHQKAADNLEYEKAAEYRVLELRLLNEIEKHKTQLPKTATTKKITKEDIAQVVSQWTRIPVGSLVKSERIRLTNLEKLLKQSIVGQDEAIQTIASAIKRSTTGIADPNRPLGSFIFLGPTGVGKTELAKVLAKEVYGKESALIKIDMSEFMERHNVSRLVGAPPGYVGFDEAGKLTEAIRRNPYSVVLLDEIEKAHPDVFNMLLQIMEDGYLTDAKGRRVNFKNTIVIMTSNIGMTELTNASTIGFQTGSVDEIGERYEKIKNQVLDKLKDNFRPEFLNRLDKVIVFRPLSKENIVEIIDRQLDNLAKRLLPEGIIFEIDNDAKKFLLEKGFNPEFGARPIRRVITEFIEDPMSEMILSGKLKKGTPIKISSANNKLKLG